jgi:hypothetical protein
VARIAALFAVCLVCSGLSAVPSPRARFGIVAFDLRDPVPAKLQDLGVGLVRGSCDWAELEPSRGVFRWDCADNVVVGASRAAIRSYVTVGCTPAWASHGGGCRRMPDDISDWYAFVGNFVARYSNYDTILGIWNEPNLTLDDPAGDNYALLFLNASRARTAVNARFVLAGPDTSHHALATGYLARVVGRLRAVDAWAPHDVFGVHWYPDGPPFDEYLETVHGIVPDKDVWLSETGIVAADPTAQAVFYGQMMARFGSPQRPWWWTHMVFYRLWDGGACCTEAILNADYTNKPAFTTYRNALAALPNPAPLPAPIRIPRN